MRWFFQKQSETELYVIYSYARESETLDGIIKVHKPSGKAEIVTPCANDNNEFSCDSTCEHAYILFREGFPERRCIACG